MHALEVAQRQRASAHWTLLSFQKGRADPAQPRASCATVRVILWKPVLHEQSHIVQTQNKMSTAGNRNSDQTLSTKRRPSLHGC